MLIFGGNYMKERKVFNKVPNGASNTQKKKIYWIYFDEVKWDIAMFNSVII